MFQKKKSHKVLHMKCFARFTVESRGCAPNSGCNCRNKCTLSLVGCRRHVVTWRDVMELRWEMSATRRDVEKTWRRRLMETTCVCRTQRRKETRSINPSINRSTIDGSTLREYKSPRKRFCRQHLATLATPTILRPASSEFSAGFVSNRRFTVFLTVTSTSRYRS